MNQKIAVLNNRHKIGFKTVSFMLNDLGFDVYSAGESFNGPLQQDEKNYPPIDVKAVKAVMEIDEMPPEALFVTPIWEHEKRLRDRGWRGPVLIRLSTVKGVEMAKKLPEIPYRTAVFAVHPEIREALHNQGLPVDGFWPPYACDIDRAPRADFDPYFIFVCRDAAVCLDKGVLAKLGDDPQVRLEMYGGGNIEWSREVEHEVLLQRIRRATALCYPKHRDNAGNALMEAMIQGVPVIVRADYIDASGAGDLLDANETCIMVMDTKFETLRQACLRLKDPKENRRIGMAGQSRLRALSNWKNNRYRLINLLSRIYI